MVQGHQGRRLPDSSVKMKKPRGPTQHRGSAVNGTTGVETRVDEMTLWTSSTGLIGRGQEPAVIISRDPDRGRRAVMLVGQHDSGCPRSNRRRGRKHRSMALGEASKLLHPAAFLARRDDSKTLFGGPSRRGSSGLLLRSSPSCLDSWKAVLLIQRVCPSARRLEVSFFYDGRGSGLVAVRRRS